MLKRILSDLASSGRALIGLRNQIEPCPVCQKSATYLGAVDFNKSCMEGAETNFHPSGQSIAYYLCRHCGYSFAPEFMRWSEAQFKERIYNEDYQLVDPDYESVRPSDNAALIKKTFGAAKDEIKHLDYGGGSGLLSQLLADDGWSSTTYDPFVDDHFPFVKTNQKFDLITAFEVMEHVPQPRQLLERLVSLCKPNGLVFFSTLIFDSGALERFSLDWWYVAPRNGHVSIFSDKSLKVLFAQYGMNVAHVDQNLHVAYRAIPDWANALNFFHMSAR